MKHPGNSTNHLAHAHSNLSATSTSADAASNALVINLADLPLLDSAAPLPPSASSTAMPPSVAGPLTHDAARGLAAEISHAPATARAIRFVDEPSEGTCCAHERSNTRS